MKGVCVTEFYRSTALPHLEVRRSCQDSPCYRPHAHDTFSIGLIDSGTSILTGSLDGTIRLEPGDVIVIPSGHVHACNPDGDSWRYQMVHMDQRWAASLTSEGEASDLFAGIRVVRHPGLPRQVAASNSTIITNDMRQAIETEFVALFQALVGMRPRHLVTSDADPDQLVRLRPVMERLRNDASNPALSDLADLAGMSAYQLVRAMRRATGLAPLAWRQNARIVQARHLLREGRPIADTAHALGFTDQSHFHRVFRSHVATSPGVYRG